MNASRVLAALAVALAMQLAPSTAAPARALTLACWPAATLLDLDSAEMEIVQLVNLLRLEEGLSPVEHEPVLSEVGRLRSWNVFERQDVSHTMPGYDSSVYWIMAQVNGATGAGENLGITCAPNHEAVGSLYNSWVASPSHLRNMLEPQFNRIGIGIVEVPLLDTPFTVKYVTQVFARAPGAVTPL